MGKKLIDENGFLRGLRFKVIENKIKEPTIYLYFKINYKTKEKSIKSPADLKSFIHDNFPKWKMYKGSIEAYSIKVEDLIPVYLHEYDLLKLMIKEMK